MARSEATSPASGLAVFSDQKGSEMASTELVAIKFGNDAAADEKVNAAEWALIFVGWVADNGFDSHAKNLYLWMQKDLLWAAYWAACDAGNIEGQKVALDQMKKLGAG